MNKRETDAQTTKNTLTKNDKEMLESVACSVLFDYPMFNKQQVIGEVLHQAGPGDEDYHIFSDALDKEKIVRCVTPLIDREWEASLAWKAEHGIK